MLCEIMKWDYLTYCQQPIWFIEGLTEKLKLDKRYEEQQMKKYKK